MKQKRQTKGFTLVEAIVVAVILVITMTVAVPSMRNFYERSKQTARNNVARSLFMSAQNALTAVYGQGRQNDFTTGAEQVTFASIQPPPAEYDENKTLLVSLNAPAGSDEATNKLLELIDRYVNDQTVLQGAILIEFNSKTGLMLACFYSDECATLGHGSGDYDVYTRDEASLRAGKVGYYGVENTGKVKESVDVNPVLVRLVDYVDPANPGITNPINGGKAYGLLTAECTLPEEPASGNTTTAHIADCIFTLSLQPLGGTPETLTVAGGTQTGTDLMLTQIRERANLADALSCPLAVTRDGTSRKIVAYTDTYTDGEGKQRERLIFVLDAPHDPTLSVQRNYPGLGNSFFTATFTARKGTKIASADSNAAHALFGGKTVGSDNGIRLTVGSVRHLNNVRYASSAVFEQTADIPVNNYLYDPATPSLSRLDFIPIGAAPTAQDSPVEFSGAYHGKNKEIQNLTITAAGDVGLFAKTASNAKVDRVYLASGSVQSTGSGEARIGGIAGTNGGEITNCSVLIDIGKKNTNGVSAAGGVAGVNNKAIRRCYVGANVDGGGAAGGIAGECSGEITYCEVGTASRSGALCTGGIPFYGAREGSTYAYPHSGSDAAVNDAYQITTTGENSGVGGIVGKYRRALGDGGTVSYCVNAAGVAGGGGNKSAGGVVGIVEITTGSNAEIEREVAIERCYNAGTVNAETAGGIAGTVVSGMIQGCYNTGLVNVEVNIVSLRSEVRVPYQFNNLHWDDDGYSGAPPDKAGGIIGFGQTHSAANGCYSAQYAGNPRGGAFGVMKGKVTGCAFLRNILNSSERYTTSENDYDDDNLTKTGLVRVSGQWMRENNISTDFFHRSGLYDAEGEGVSRRVTLRDNRVGPFGYKLPYFNFGADNLGDDFHRTPYQKLAENYGDIRLSLEGSILEIRFNVLLDNRAKPSIVLTTHDDSTVRFDLDTNDQLDAMYNARTVEDAVAVTGEKWEFGTVPITGKGYRSLVYDTNAEERYRGMNEEYIIRVAWNDLPNNALWVEAELFGTVYNRTTRTDEDGNKYFEWDQDSDALYDESNRVDRPLIIPYQPGIVNNVTTGQQHFQGTYTTTEIVFAPPAFTSGVELAILFDYVNFSDASGGDDIIKISNEQLTEARAWSFDDIVSGHNDARIRLNETGQKRYALYYSGELYHLVLFMTGWPTDSNQFNKSSNGLKTNEPFYVKIIYNGERATGGPYTIE